MKAPALAKNTIPELLTQAGTQYASLPALTALDVPGGRTITFAELLSDVQQLARGLARLLGVSRGTHVAIIGKNSPEWAKAYLAISMAGGINVPVDPLLSENEIRQLLAGGKVEAVFADPKFIDILTDSPLGEHEQYRLVSLERESSHNKPPKDGDAPEDLSVHTTVHTIDELHRAGSNASETITLPEPDSSDTAAIIFTSGTTGSPKGVVLTHSNIVSDVIACEHAISGHLEIGNERFLSVLPVNHMFECTAGFLLPIYMGCHITYARSLRSRYLMEDIRSSGTTVMLGVPLLFQKMVEGIHRAVEKAPLVRRKMFYSVMAMVKAGEKVGKFNLGRTLFRSLREKAGLGSLKFFISGGAALPFFVSQEMNRLGLTILQGYGLTEASPVLTINPADAPRNETIGPPLPGVQVRVLDPSPEGIGELAFKGPMIMKGYYHDDETTARVLHDGWLATGDIGFVDQDGFVHVCGRSKNLIVTAAGKNVYPEEVEAELNRQPFILETMVYGRQKGNTAGEDVCCVVVPDFEKIAEDFPDRVLSETEVQELISQDVKRANALIAPYKRVKDFKIFNEELPKTSTRKIKRHLVNVS